MLHIRQSQCCLACTHIRPARQESTKRSMILRRGRSSATRLVSVAPGRDRQNPGLLFKKPWDALWKKANPSWAA